jgi:hypothetical protein
MVVSVFEDPNPLLYRIQGPTDEIESAGLMSLGVSQQRLGKKDSGATGHPFRIAPDEPWPSHPLFGPSGLGAARSVDRLDASTTREQRTGDL